MRKRTGYREEKFFVRKGRQEETDADQMEMHRTEIPQEKKRIRESREEKGKYP